MANRHSVQQAVIDRDSVPCSNELNTAQRESIANEMQSVQTTVDAFEFNDDDDQQLIFREVVLGDAQLRTND